jgi:hypothetical protein
MGPGATQFARMPLGQQLREPAREVLNRAFRARLCDENGIRRIGVTDALSCASPAFVMRNIAPTLVE